MECTVTLFFCRRLIKLKQGNKQTERHHSDYYECGLVFFFIALLNKKMKKQNKPFSRESAD